MNGATHRQERITKLTLMAIFIGAFVSFVAGTPPRRRRRWSAGLRPSDALLLVGSTFRLGRMVAFDKVFDPIRAPFTVTKPDDTGAGMSVEPSGWGGRRVIGELLACPICAGTWISAGLVYALHTFPGPARVFMTIMSTIGMAEILHALTEHLSWMGTYARKEAGAED